MEKCPFIELFCRRKLLNCQTNLVIVLYQLHIFFVHLYLGTPEVIKLSAADGAIIGHFYLFTFFCLLKKELKTQSDLPMQTLASVSH